LSDSQRTEQVDLIVPREGSSPQVTARNVCGRRSPPFWRSAVTSSRRPPRILDRNARRL